MEQTSSRINKIISTLNSPHPRYQYLLIIFMCACWLQIAYSAMIGSYVFMNPLFECQNGQSATEVQACKDLRKCRITNDFTAAYYDGLYCEQKQMRATIQSIYALGALIGMFGPPALADFKGRKFSYLLSFWLQLAGISIMLLGIYQNISPLILIGQLLTGIFGAGIVVLTYVMVGEFCTDKMRQTTILLFNAVWGLAEMSFYLLYNYMPQWHFYLIFVIGIPSILLTIISYFLVIQSPDYCLILAKSHRLYCQSIDKIGKWNHASNAQIQICKKQGEQILSQIAQRQSNELTFKQQMLKIFNSKPALIPCLCLALSQLAYNIFYFGVQGSLERTGYNFGFSMLLIGLHQFLAYLAIGYFIDKIQRKKGLAISIMATSAIGLTFMIQWVDDNQVMQSIVISITRVGCVFAYSLISILETQSFQADIRSTAIGLTKALSQLGRIGVPYLVTAMNDVGIHPIIAASFFFLTLGIIPLIPVKQTLRKQNLFLERVSINEGDSD